MPDNQCPCCGREQSKRYGDQGVTMEAKPSRPNTLQFENLLPTQGRGHLWLPGCRQDPGVEPATLTSTSPLGPPASLRLPPTAITGTPHSIIPPFYCPVL